MGWFNDDFPGHDGYMVGIEHDAEHGDYREFSRQSLPAGWKEVLLAEREGSATETERDRPTRPKLQSNLRRIGPEAPTSPSQRADLTVPLRFVAMGCECGWRSPRLHAPMGLVYVAFSVEWENATERGSEKKRHDDFDQSMIALWTAHLHQAPIEPGNIRLPSDFRRRS